MRATVPIPEHTHLMQLSEVQDMPVKHNVCTSSDDELSSSFELQYFLPEPSLPQPLFMSNQSTCCATNSIRLCPLQTRARNAPALLVHGPMTQTGFRLCGCSIHRRLICALQSDIRHTWNAGVAEARMNAAKPTPMQSP